VLLSPIVVVGLGFVLARITLSIWGAWSWIPIIIYYWGVLVALIAWGGGREAGWDLHEQAAGYGSGGFYRSRSRPSSSPQRFSRAWRP
jgi:hypothetical protein